MRRCASHPMLERLGMRFEGRKLVGSLAQSRWNRTRPTGSGDLRNTASTR